MITIGGVGDRAVIGAYEVQFIDVARTLRKLHKIGKLLFENNCFLLPQSGAGSKR